MRYAVQPQKHSERFPYDGGYALWDQWADKQFGWCRLKERAERAVTEAETKPPVYNAPPKYTPRKP